MPIETNAPQMPPLHRQVRWWILALLFCVTILNFIDRQTLAVLQADITKEFKLSNTAFGTIGSVFRAGMMLGEFPVGWMMDRIGVRIGLGLAVLWWSLGNGLNAAATSLKQFLFFRFWLGTGECGNYSGGNKIIATWFPVRERALAIGIFNSASMLGAFIASFLIIWISERFGWRMGFLAPSLLGVIWVAAWWWLYRQPQDHPRLTEAEQLHINSDIGESSQEPIPTNAQLLRLPQTWGLILCRFWVGSVLDFYFLWMPKYFYDIRGLSAKASAYSNSLTFIFGDIGSISGGLAAGWLLKKGLEVKSARRATMLFGAALCLLGIVIPFTSSIAVAIAMISLVLLGHTFLSANMFASVSDVFPNSAVARVTGLTGMANGLSGIIFPFVTGWIVDKMGYTPVFTMAALMPMLGVCIALYVLKDYRRVNLKSEI